MNENDHPNQPIPHTYLAAASRTARRVQSPVKKLVAKANKTRRVSISARFDTNDYDAVISYVPIEHVNFSQSTVTYAAGEESLVPDDHATSNEVKCHFLRHPVRFVFHQDDLYVIGFFGLARHRSKKPISKYYPLMEAVDYDDDRPFVTMNNRRLYLIHRLLMAFTDQNPEALSGTSFLETLPSVKACLNVNNIYIPVHIVSSDMNVSYDDTQTYGEFLENRLGSQGFLTKEERGTDIYPYIHGLRRAGMTATSHPRTIPEKHRDTIEIAPGENYAAFLHDLFHTTLHPTKQTTSLCYQTSKVTTKRAYLRVCSCHGKGEKENCPIRDEADAWRTGGGTRKKRRRKGKRMSILT